MAKPYAKLLRDDGVSAVSDTHDLLAVASNVALSLGVTLVTGVVHGSCLGTLFLSALWFNAARYQGSPYTARLVAEIVKRKLC